MSVIRSTSGAVRADHPVEPPDVVVAVDVDRVERRPRARSTGARPDELLGLGGVRQRLHGVA